MTLALRCLEDAGCIRRREDGRMILTQAGELEVAAITKAGAAEPTLAASLRLDGRLSQTQFQSRAFDNAAGRTDRRGPPVTEADRSSPRAA